LRSHARSSPSLATGRLCFFGNNPGGRSAIPANIPGEIRLGFRGVGGVIRDGVAEYVRIKQQPTALAAADDPRLADMERALRQREFGVQRIADMDGWLVYHAAFVACVAAALYRWRSATGGGQCAHPPGNCALPPTPGTLNQRCGHSATR